MGTYMSLAPPFTQKQGLHKMETSWHEKKNNSPNIVESNCSPQCLLCQPFVIVCTVIMNHTDLFESASNLRCPRCVWMLGETTAWVCNESWVPHAEEPEGWSEERQHRWQKTLRIRQRWEREGAVQGKLRVFCVQLQYPAPGKQPESKLFSLPRLKGSNPC